MVEGCVRSQTYLMWGLRMNFGDVPGFSNAEKFDEKQDNL